MATDRQNARRFALVAGLVAVLSLFAVVLGLTMGSCQEPDRSEAITAPGEPGPSSGAPGVEP